MILLNPGAPPRDESLALAPRKFSSLDGLRLGLLGNSKLNADNVLNAVGELLQERYAIETILHNKKPSFSHPAPEPIRDEMVEKCDVVIAGVGD
jgi:hypothetical protein